MTHDNYGPFGKPNPLRGWYTANVRSNPDEKLRLVREQPDLAERVFHIFGDAELGNIYLRERPHDPAVFHIARELGIRMSKDSPDRWSDKESGLGEEKPYESRMHSALQTKGRRVIRKGGPLGG